MKKLYVFILFFVIALFTTCKKDNFEISSQPSTYKEDVNLETALIIAKVFRVPASIKGAPPIKGKNGKFLFSNDKAINGIKNSNQVMTAAIDFKTKIIDKYFTLKNSSGDPSMYVINYTNGGFLIISASQKEHPVLAYSDVNSFPEEMTRGTHPVNIWILSESEKIKALRSNRIQNADSLVIQSEWKKYAAAPTLNSNLKVTPTPNVPLCENGHWDFTLHQCVSCPDGYTWDGYVCQPPPPCQTEYTIGPLLSTFWDQGCGYNAYTPIDNDQNYCNHTPAGCEAVAIGQILKFWHTGNVFLPQPGPKGVNGTWGVQTYDYSDSAMPLYSGSNEVSRLFRDIGSAVGMSYAQSGSGANPNHPTFFYEAGFSSDVKETNYSTNDILGDLSYGRPCLLGGFTYAFFPWNAEGHEWVCDGLHAVPNTCYPSYWSGYNVTVHLNWGWSGYCNGWYSPGSWIPTDSNGNEVGPRFLHNLSEVINIHL